MAPLASVTEYFLSVGLLRFVFHITGHGVLRFLSSFGAGVLFMSFTGMLTYWLVVGLSVDALLPSRDGAPDDSSATGGAALLCRT
jgi:hypothetical protein